MYFDNFNVNAYVCICFFMYKKLKNHETRKRTSIFYIFNLDALLKLLFLVCLKREIIIIFLKKTYYFVSHKNFNFFSDTLILQTEIFK